MEKVLILTTVVGLVLALGCGEDSSSNGEGECEIKEKTISSKSHFVECPTAKISRMKVEGHQYLIFEHNGAPFWVAHDPECPCQRLESTIVITPSKTSST